MSVQELLGREFVRAYEHEDGDLIVLETAHEDLFEIYISKEGFLIDKIDGFDDARFTAVDIEY